MSENPSIEKEENPMPTATTAAPKKGRSRKVVPASDRKATQSRAQARAAKGTSEKNTTKAKSTKNTKAKSTKAKGAEKSKIEKGGPKVGMEVVKKVCAAMKDNPEATSRAAIRKASGIEKLGLPWLVDNGYVKQEVEEGQRAHKFTLTAKGKKFK